METMRIQLAEGKQFLHPDTLLPMGATPIIVPKNGFWTRRVRDGSVVVVADEPAKDSALKKPATGNGSN
jgi:hypothetical protein